MIHRFSKDNVYLIDMYMSIGSERVSDVFKVFYKKFSYWSDKSHGAFSLGTRSTRKPYIYKLDIIYKRPRNTTNYDWERIK